MKKFRTLLRNLNKITNYLLVASSRFSSFLLLTSLVIYLLEKFYISSGLNFKYLKYFIYYGKYIFSLSLYLQGISIIIEFSQAVAEDMEYILKKS